MIADTWNRTRGLKIQPIHYKGESPMWVDVSTGEVTAGVGSFEAMQPYRRDRQGVLVAHPRAARDLRHSEPADRLGETRQRWRDEAPKWIELADRLGIKLD